MIGRDELQRMSPQQRLELAQAIVMLDGSPPGASRGSARRRTVALALTIGSCVVLAGWIAVLALTLPRFYTTGGWRGAWVGFDGALLLAFAATGWAAWRRRQLLIICLVVLATLLCCDAWFDVVLDAHTSGFGESLLLALLVELPLAALAILAARRLLRLTTAMMTGPSGNSGAVRLRDIPLLGLGPERRIRDLLAEITPPAPPAAGGDPGRSSPVGAHDGRARPGHARSRQAGAA